MIRSLGSENCWLKHKLTNVNKQLRKRFHYIKNRIKVRKRGRPHQPVGHRLLMLVQVHEMVVVSGGGENSECGENGEQEASGVACKHINTDRRK